jgi:hypothetical protein
LIIAVAVGRSTFHSPIPVLTFGLSTTARGVGLGLQEAKTTRATKKSLFIISVLVFKFEKIPEGQVGGGHQSRAFARQKAMKTS